MASEVKLPQLGENLTGGEVLDVRVKAGDSVSEGQTLLEVEAEKATVEVPAPSAGRITKMLVNKGDAIEVGQTLCLIESADGAQQADSKEAPVREASAAKTEPEPRTAAKRKEKPSEPKKEAATPKSRQEAAKQTEETSSDEEAEKPAAAERPAAAKATPDGRPKTEPPPAPAGEKPVAAGPATRRLARELGVDLEQVRGSAPNGRVTEEDIKTYIRYLASGQGNGPARVQLPPLPDFERWGPVERQPLEGVRRKTAEHTSLAWTIVPHVTQQDQADVTDLETFRKQLPLTLPSPPAAGGEGRVRGDGPKLTITAFALKAAAIALRQFPQFNASLDLAGSQLVLKKYYHIGVAVDTDRGLLVPVLLDVDSKTIQALAAELADVADRARQKKLRVEEMRGGTFTITNLGGIGGTGFSPIINYPEVAILGLSRSRLQPVVQDGQVVPRLLLPLSLSYDHRVIDGANAARFTRRIAELLENPLLMLLHA